ncbi:DUF421 domain-containing protein [Hansschlegelia beijingensis]|uniref:DUF421 domain-containing protein n=1 Tax=Hansschlegelia beijingensis TaxID=1133344 RepID=UPI00387F312E
MFFDSWTGLFRVLVVGICAYGALVVFLRISGKRTLAKLNAFDLVVTVALGSTLSSIILTKSVALLEGLLALALLIVLQLVITWLSVRSERFKKLIKAEPTLLLYEGRLLEGPMQAQRVTREDLLSAVRSQGVGDLSAVAAVVLETDGSISVVQKPPGKSSSLQNVEGISEAATGLKS